jgi:catechol 2,3-dioxygenase
MLQDAGFPDVLKRCNLRRRPDTAAPSNELVRRRWLSPQGIQKFAPALMRRTPSHRGVGAKARRYETNPSSPEAEPMSAPIDPRTRIGHVHLRVADLDRALGFYCGVLGFTLMQRYGTQAAFVSAGGYHHHIGLNTWDSAGGSPPPPGSTGLYHTAILYPTRAALADALARLDAAGIPLTGASDHGVSEALYLDDPDRNGVELYRDRPEDEWPRDEAGGLRMVTRRLDLAALRADNPSRGGPAGG